MSGWQGNFLSSLSEWGTVQRHALGVVRKEDGGKLYKYVTLNQTVTVAGSAGDQVLYFAATGYQNNRVVARAADGDAVPFAAGVLTAAVTGTLNIAYYGWIQIKGLVTLSQAITNGAAGKRFTGQNVNATFIVCANASDPTAGICMNATTGAVLDCPF